MSGKTKESTCVKTCPFKSVDRDATCDRENCQLWIAIVKPRTFRTIEHPFRETKDEIYEYQYEGCGLVQETPWELVKKEGKT